MHRKIVFLLVFISTILFFTLPVQAMMCWDDMMGWFGEKKQSHVMEAQKEVYQTPKESLEGRFYVDLKDELNLTNAQVKALDEISRKYETAKTNKVVSIDKFEKKLLMLQAQKEINMDEIKKTVDEIENLRKEIKLDYVNNNEQAKKLLTDEQLERLLKISNYDSETIEKGKDGKGTRRENTTTGHERTGTHNSM